MKIFGKEYKIVYEKDQKDKANTLYLYIENIDDVIYAKFGEAFKQGKYAPVLNTVVVQDLKALGSVRGLMQLNE